jgi:hypothetical protein
VFLEKTLTRIKWLALLRGEVLTADLHPIQFA